MFLDHNIPMNCPVCGLPHQRTIRAIETRQPIHCNCGTTIEIEHTGLEEIHKVDASLKRLRQTLSQFGR